ncbi:Hsp20/alpha crystallin family protein [Brucepastera parasyntrophica]|uniref:Hsp20/alpha crystallin family protein n=1 Tax=Brucepastera parasyntrophica TaxID=2880008 RepID=UPI00210CD184|nr:Hsp20/alpha crystallin family protein [Brucepastera parasyntrophica]ULQ60974.1 Hsp20/alpha crystallin family protein [Brucepastera parasyntrophica]
MKSVAVYKPKSIDKAIDDFDSLVGAFFDDPSLADYMRHGSLPAVDITETENSYILEAELTGYDEKNVEVFVDGNTLGISSTKEETDEKKEKKYIRRERTSESFNRFFTLPENADPDSVSANFKNGLLTIEIKKKHASKKRMVEIKKNNN